ncbi:MAG: hypothetical protein ACI8W8_002616 [Rhodothermales bacterium]|jgi:hypothetical protein
MSRVLTLSLLIWGLGAQAQVSLSWKNPDGAVRKLKASNESKQRLMLGEHLVDSSSTTSMLIRKKITTRAEGTQVAMSIDSLRSTISVPTLPKLEFDSTKPDETFDNPILAGIRDTLRATANLQWTIDVDAQAHVTGVSGFATALDKLSEELKPSVAGIFADDYQMQVAQQEIDQLPKKAVRPGDEWTRKFIYRIERGQQLTFSLVYRYEGTAERGGQSLHKISMRATDVIYSTNQGAATPYELLDQDLRVRESSGVLYFDNSAGQVVESTMTTRIVGSMVFGTGVGELPAKLDSSFSVSMSLEK